MHRTFPMQRLAPGLTGAAALAAVTLAGCNGAHDLEAQPPAGAATIMLRLPDSLGPLRRSAVAFDHDRHTKRLKQKGCDPCHQQLQGKLVYKFARLEDGQDSEALMELYHERCIGCHREQNRDGGQSKAPVTCGECHSRTTPARSSWAAIGYDTSLHFRHVKALNKSCKECHHVYDAANKALVYKKGAEDSCSACHGQRDGGKDGARALRKAAHDSCLKCHQARGEAKQSTGPVDCAGCHDPARQRKYKQLKATARLISGQKDALKIHTAGAVAGGVKFDHKGHEQAAGFCTTCHHQGKQPCGKCHTLTGTDKGGGVVLERAHHLASSERSCVGCHDKATAHRDCAGCHSALPAPPSQGSCGGCHGKQGQAAAATATAGLAPLPAASDDFPEQVVIKSLAHKYKPTRLPHRKIVAALDAAVRKSKLARAMHGDTQTLCAGCHHHSPPGRRPPACRSCHGDQGHPTRDRPGLQAAYHRQCIGCHVKMGIKQQGCTDCHAAAKQETSK